MRFWLCVIREVPRSRAIKHIRMSKVIVSCAITGAVHTPSMSPYPPVTPQEIADQTIACGTIAHLHARDPINGRPTASKKA